MNQLAKEIKESGLKKSYIAKELGVTPVYLSYCLNGKRDMTDDLKYRILRIIKK